MEEDPFASKIMVASPSKGFKESMIKAYDRVTDQLDHLRTFVDLMRLYTARNAVMCQSFLLTLRRGQTLGRNSGTKVYQDL